jgi:hypothetical protein
MALARSSKAKQVLGLVIACFWASSFTATAQQTPSIFGASQLPVEPVVQALPPEGSPILLKQVELRFPTQDNVGGNAWTTGSTGSWDAPKIDGVCWAVAVNELAQKQAITKPKTCFALLDRANAILELPLRSI